MEIKVDSRKNCYSLGDEVVKKIEEEISSSTTLESGVYAISIKSGTFSDVNDPTKTGQPLVLLWIYGKFINKQNNIPASATWVSLNSYDDKLTLEVIEKTTVCAFFFDSDSRDNAGEIRLNLQKVGVIEETPVVTPPKPPIPVTPPDTSLPDVGELTPDNIYQVLWENDENQFSVSPRNSEGEWENPDADILLDEQVKASGKRSIDLATRPLFHQVNEEKLLDSNRTYNSFIKLLDNYAIRYLDPEFTTEEEVAEQQHFLDLIINTKPIQIAREYINQQFGENISLAKFRQNLQRMWFEIYTNYYRGKSTEFCSGFEHVFVGEGKFDLHAGNKKENLGKISGYHSWVKFYLDEKNQRVNYLGYKYDLKGQAGIANPNVVTLQQLQTVTDMQGNVIAELIKEKGGFFVGASPECEIAIASVAFYESVNGRIEDKRRAKMDGAKYDLVVYRNINPNGSRGEFIRSFFPIFIGLDDFEEPEIDRPEIIPVEDVLKNDGAIVITSALPNPEGRDEGNEWVEIKNVTDMVINLSGWQLQDKFERGENLSGEIQPQETQRITVLRSSPNSMQMTNKSGLISLVDNQSEVIAKVKYSKARSGTILSFAV